MEHRGIRGPGTNMSKDRPCGKSRTPCQVRGCPPPHHHTLVAPNPSTQHVLHRTAFVLYYKNSPSTPALCSTATFPPIFKRQPCPLAPRRLPCTAPVWLPSGP